MKQSLRAKVALTFLLAESDPRAAKLKPEQFIDARFFQELEKEGFIQRLWQ
jgi:hypothetical protein